jgi:hypothetical protein
MKILYVLYALVHWDQCSKMGYSAISIMIINTLRGSASEWSLLLLSLMYKLKKTNFTNQERPLDIKPFSSNI